MQCKLCLQEKPLIKKSHIIPDFMYKGLFDSKHKIAQKDFVNNRESFPPTGIYDRYILCANCDNNVLGGYETYAAKELFKPSMHEFIHNIKEIFNHHNRNIDLKISKLHYQSAKLFLLSILWRASISKHPFFKFVDLDIISSEQIRKMLLTGFACQSDLFEIIIQIFLPDGTRPYFSVGAPRMIPFEENQSYYTFIINSFLFFFNVSNDSNKNAIFENGYINENGDFTLFILTDNIARDIFDGLMGRNINYKGPFMQ